MIQDIFETRALYLRNQIGKIEVRLIQNLYLYLSRRNVSRESSVSNVLIFKFSRMFRGYE